MRIGGRGNDEAGRCIVFYSRSYFNCACYADDGKQLFFGSVGTFNDRLDVNSPGSEGQTLMLKEMDFVKAAKVMGASRRYIMFKHILPNCSGQILVSLMLNIPSAIFAESTLSFLGLGIRPPEASWGTMVNEGFKYTNITYHPWVVFLPLLFIAITMISLNILGMN